MRLVVGHFYLARHGRIVGPMSWNQVAGFIIYDEFAYTDDGGVALDRDTDHDLIEDVTVKEYLANPLGPWKYQPNPSWLSGFLEALEVQKARGFISTPVGSYQ